MNNNKPSNARKIPEEEKKIGSTLRAQLYFEPEETVDVVIIGEKTLEYNSSLSELVSSHLEDSDVIRGVGRTMLSATVNPPEILRKLVSIASNESIQAIELNEPLPPITIPKSYFNK
jgi:hypothetical protein